MSPTLSAVVISRLEKSAMDNGFDLELARAGDWLAFASTQSALRVWLSTDDDAIAVGFSQGDVVHALADYGGETAIVLPDGAVGSRTVSDFSVLHRLLRRAFQLGKSLPDQLLHVFMSETAALPRATEAERLVIQRVGQDVYREGLLDFWDHRCAITGLAVPALLRASHIKPWAHCETDAERLDVFNGFLLAPHLDAAFDDGFITVADDGAVMVSETLDLAARHILNLGEQLRVVNLTSGHRNYLPWHRDRIFRRPR
jgi:putative restriction endonuclease